MNKPAASTSPDRGDQPIRDDGYSYLPRFITAVEASELIAFFAGLHPLIEARHAQRGRSGAPGQLTRPVYWLGAWQFAALGYYSEPDHVKHRCVRAEPIPPLMLRILERLRPELTAHGDPTQLPNTCLINYYGRTPKSPGVPPVDHARLRMHRDHEPGPVVMFSVGQPAQFEFVTPGADTPEHAQWLRHRSVTVVSGPEYKRRLYHRVTRVRYGQEPVLSAPIPDFDVRRISVSFRYVPEQHICDLGELGEAQRAIAQPYVEQLADHSEHFRGQLQGLRPVADKAAT